MPSPNPYLPHFFYSDDHNDGETAGLLCCRSCYLTPGKVDPDDSETFVELETWWCTMAHTCRWCGVADLSEHYDMQHLGGEIRRTCAYCIAEDAEENVYRWRVSRGD